MCNIVPWSKTLTFQSSKDHILDFYLNKMILTRKSDWFFSWIKLLFWYFWRNIRFSSLQRLIVRMRRRSILWSICWWRGGSFGFIIVWAGNKWSWGRCGNRRRFLSIRLVSVAGRIHSSERTSVIAHIVVVLRWWWRGRWVKSVLIVLLLVSRIVHDIYIKQIEV